jgi:pimeloyl-ACP methyl ester carboxylesterase
MSGDWVLLRGLAREAAHWGGFVERLQARVAPARVAAIDLPGAGAARHLPVPLQVDGLVAHVRAEVARQGLRPSLHVVGLSLGGMVAARWAESAPGSLARVVLINSSLRPHGLPWQRLRPGAWAPLLAAWLSLDARAAERQVLAATSARRGLDEASVLDAWVQVRRERPVARADALRQLLAAVRHRASPVAPRVPVSLLASAQDRLVDPACSRRLARAWGCTLALHPWAGHDLPLDDPHWVLAQLLAADQGTDAPTE